MEDPGNPALEAPPKRVFESERLRMRTTTMGDVDAMIPIMTNPETMLYTRGVVNVTSRSVAETWLKTRCMGRDVLSFMITLKPDEAKRRGFDGSQEHVVGILGGHHPPEIGYILHIDHAGHGYATEALRTFIPFYFSIVPSAAETARPECDYMQGRTDFENFASQKVLTKCGFTFIEHEKDTFDNVVLGMRDVHCYRLPRPGTKLVMKEDEEEPPRPPVE